MEPFVVHSNIIDSSTCASIIGIYKKNIHLSTLRYSEESNSLREISLKENDLQLDNVINSIVENLSPTLSIYLDQFKHVNLPLYYFSHAVIMHQTEFNNIPSHYDSEWVPEKEGEMPQRHFNCLLYLNNDFDGGEIIFPLQKKVFKPEPGMLLVFPTSFMFPHLTAPSIGNDRFVVGLNYYYKDPGNRRNQEKI